MESVDFLDCRREASTTYALRTERSSIAPIKAGL